MPENAATGTTIGYRLGLAALLLACSALIAMTAYLPAPPTATRALLRIGLPITFLACTLILRWRQPGGKLWPAPLAFFSISLGICLAGPVDAWRMQLPGLDSTGTRPGLVAAKVAEALPVIVSILVVSRLAGAGGGSLYLCRGRLGRSLAWGLLISLFTLVPFFAMGGPASLAVPGPARVIAALPWALAFTAVNGFYEELWFRGLLLSHFEALLSGRGALIVTSLAFAALHFASSYMSAEGLVQLVAVTLALGLAYGYLVQKTGTLWGAVLAHTLADMMLLLGHFAAL